MAGAQIKLLRCFVVLVNDTAIGSRQTNRAGDDGFEHSFEIQRGAHRLAYFAERFQFLDRFHQLAGSFL